MPVYRDYAHAGYFDWLEDEAHNAREEQAKEDAARFGEPQDPPPKPKKPDSHLGKSIDRKA